MCNAVVEAGEPQPAYSTGGRKFHLVAVRLGHKTKPATANTGTQVSAHTKRGQRRPSHRLDDEAAGLPRHSVFTASTHSSAHAIHTNRPGLLGGLLHSNTDTNHAPHCASQIPQQKLTRRDGELSSPISLKLPKPSYFMVRQEIPEHEVSLATQVKSYEAGFRSQDALG